MSGPVEQSEEGRALPSDRATHEQSPQAVSAVPVGIPSAVDDLYDYYEEDDCGNCGGEGFTYGCSWDWQCETYDAGEDTCLCTRRCEWCNPLSPAEIAERDKLRDILATALAKDKIAEMRAQSEQPS